MKQPALIFFGTSKFAVPILTHILEANFNVPAVVTTPDKPAGRDHMITPSPIKEFAQAHNLWIEQPEKPSFPWAKKLPKAALYVIASYGKILPRELLNIPSYGVLNVHPSLLPKYRGPSPIQTTILKGEEKTGVTIMLTDEEMDHGPILAVEEVSIKPSQTAKTLEESLALTGALLLIKTIPRWIAGSITPRKQDHTKATFTKLLTREDGRVIWTTGRQAILNQSRAFTPWPGIWTFLKSEDKRFRVKILSISAGAAQNFKQEDSGKIITDKNTLRVITPDGFLELDGLQLEGHTATTGNTFVRAYIRGNARFI